MIRKLLRKVILSTFIVLISLGAAQAQETFNVTFKIDMNDAITKQNFIVGTHQVAIAGSFNGWAAMTDFLTDEDEDGVYERTFALAPGSHLYKYTLSSLQYQPFEWDNDPNRSIEVVDQDIILEPDTFSKSFIDYSTVTTDNFAIHFQVNMSYQTSIGNFNAETDSVFIKGPFDGWGVGVLLTEAENSGVFEATLNYDSFPIGGDVLYKFVIISNSVTTWESFDGNRVYIVEDIDYSEFNRDENSRIMLQASDEVPYFNNEMIEEIATDNFAIHFQVNMNQQITLGNFESGVDQVFLKGALDRKSVV